MKSVIHILLSLYLLSSLPSVNVNASYNSPIDSMISVFKYTDVDTLRNQKLRLIAKILVQLEDSIALNTWNELIEYCVQKDLYHDAGYCAYRLARRYRANGDYFKSYESFNKSLEYYEKIGNKTELALTYNGFGSLLKDLQDYKQSFDYYTKSAQLYRENNNTVQEGIVYLNTGGMLEEQGALELAKYYLNKSINILEPKNNDNLINSYLNLGIVFNKEKKSDSAFYYFYKSKILSDSLDNNTAKFNGNYYLGNFLFEQNRINDAEPYLEEATQIFENPENKNIVTVKYKADFTNLLSQFYASKNNYVKAYLYLHINKEYEAENKINEAQVRVDRKQIQMEKNLAEIEAERRQTVNTVALSLLALTLILLFSMYRSYKHKQRANKLLTEMDELKNRLYSNITHELRTPLTLILGPLEQMLSSETEKAPSRKQVKMMRKNANSLLNLVNQMLDLSKIDAKNMKLELVEDDINKFLRTRFAAFASLAGQKSIIYNCSLLNEKNIRIFDASKLEKIINNLLSNAIKFTRNKGTISCYANFLHPNTLELIVKDDGKGIPKDELNIIFHRFHQAKTNDEIINIGTGIGLSLTKELVELMHGKIEVESEVGRGSKFKVTLPLGTAHLNNEEFQMIQNHHTQIHNNAEISEPVDIADECDNTQDSNHGKEKLPHVLVVEDNIDILEFIAENLNDCFFIEKAGNGKTGLKRAIKNIPDLVITDIVMPKMDGIELCNNLKTDERTSHIPVVMLTGKSSIDDRLQGLETGADAYLTKPFNIKELRLQVTKLIEQRQKLRERFTRDLRLEPKDIAVTSADQKFITRVMEIVEKNIGNSEFEVRQFEEEMYMSRMQLFRKIKALTNQTPGEFIRTIRLKRAESLIKQNFGNIAQITYEVGFNNPSYFAKCFKDLYGELPSNYLKNQN